ncbi:MAG: sulfite exporter TauE/SafE family protein [Acetobacteraceae bacterium]|nr:sulfite exporter TauE/SafE family protein [Acetobacteraceae bacterium]
MTEPLKSLLPIAATFILAGLIKGVVGLGLPTVAMGLLGLFMPPAKAASLLLIPAFVTNIWQLLEGPGLRPLLRRLSTLLAGVAIGTVAGAGLIAGAAGPAATAGLGAALVVYAAIGLSKVAFGVRPLTERWASPLVGVTTGLITGATGTFVIPAVPYISALGLERDDLVQALGLSFTVSTVALAAGLAWHGALQADLAATSVTALVPALAGMWLGGVVRRRVSGPLFRRVFLAGLLTLGAELLWRSLG